MSQKKLILYFQKYPDSEKYFFLTIIRNKPSIKDDSMVSIKYWYLLFISEIMFQELTSKAVLNVGATGPAKKIAEETIETVVKNVVTAPIKGAGIYCKQSLTKPREQEIDKQGVVENLEN